MISIYVYLTHIFQDRGMKGSDYNRVAEAIRYLTANLEGQPSLAELANHLGLSKSHAHRLFRKWAGITPKDFLQSLTLARAKMLLSASHSVLETSLALGLSGGSRLYDLFVGLDGMTPGAYKNQASGQVIRWGIYPSVFGDAFLAATDRGVCALAFIEDHDPSHAFTRLKKQWPAAELVYDPQLLRSLAHDINDRMQGIEKGKLALSLNGSAFQIKVWQALLEVPDGQVVTYQSLAKFIGMPTAARAVGSAVGANPIAYLIPCHRVIRASGVIGEYHWGSERKELMLAVESARKNRS